MRIVLNMLFISMLGVAPLTAAEVPLAFRTKPSAVKVGDDVKITFAVNRSTDVAVEILDPNGGIVRHLGAAVLGDNAPAPFQKGSLKQELIWDGKDDKGKPAAGGPFSVRVRVGLRVAFDRFLDGGNRPPLSRSLYGALAVDGSGNIYALCNPRKGHSNIMIVFSREGRYLRTIVPFSNKTPAERLRGVDLLCSKPGRLSPRVYERVRTTFLPQFQELSRQTMAITSEGRLVLASGWPSHGGAHGFGPRTLLVLNTDGSIPRERLNGPVLGKGSGYLHVAVSPDGKFAYVCGLYKGRHFKFNAARNHHNVVYRVGLSLDAKPEIFFGELHSSGNDGKHLDRPLGIGVDGEGAVYVSDFGNNRVVVLGPDGAYRREIKVERPGVLAVHPETGTVYVVSHKGVSDKSKGLLVKYDKQGKRVWEQALGGFSMSRMRQHPSIALDWHADRPIVYLGTNSIWTRYSIRKVTDLGGKCEIANLFPPSRFPGKNFAGLRGLPSLKAVGSQDRAYVKYSPSAGHAISQIHDGATGKRRAWWPRYYDDCVTLGRDGRLYRFSGYSTSRVSLKRVAIDGKPVPFSATGELTEEIRPVGTFRSGPRNNLFVTAAGHMYMLAWRDRGADNAELCHLTPDGKMKETLITGLPAAVGVRLDRRGNIFVAANLKPPGRYWPAEITPFVSTLDHGGQVEYAWLYGSVLKFRPTGGSVRLLSEGKPADAQVMVVGYGQRGRRKRKYAVKGLLGSYPGISPLPPPKAWDSRCNCNYASFDLDLHDRLFIPDAARFRVHVLDSNFNPILDFGGYGNIDDPTGKAAAPGPEIPLTCPKKVCVSDKAAYVEDYSCGVQRIVRVKLAYEKEDTCQIP